MTSLCFQIQKFVICYYCYCLLLLQLHFAYGRIKAIKNVHTRVGRLVREAHFFRANRFHVTSLNFFVSSSNCSKKKIALVVLD